MEKDTKTPRLAREDWLRAALALSEKGIEQVKIAPLAADMGVTTGSFYWHFKNRRELLDALLDYWEREMTDNAITASRAYTGDPVERIRILMEAVMSGGMARYDLPISQWAQSDAAVTRVFERVLKKRFEHAAWMFAQAGFSDEQAEVRGHMMVVYMMGESTFMLDSRSRRKALIAQQLDILTGRG